MKKYKLLLILLNLAVLLWIFNRSVYEKEAVLSNGKLVFLQLAPIDSFPDTQSEFINLKFPQLEMHSSDGLPLRGYCMVRTDGRGVVDSLRIQAEILPQNDGEFALEYVLKNGQVNIGANTFYFQKGRMNSLLNARYAGLKTGKDGNAVLFGLFDEHFARLE
jgi:uncharacterized membrane-anchored protein